MADGRGAVGGVFDEVVNAGDGDGLWRVPVAVGKGQCVTDGGRHVVATGGGDDEVADGLGVEDDGVGGGASGFSDSEAGRSRQDDAGDVVVDGGDAHVAGDAAVAAAAGGMDDVEGIVNGVVIVDAGDGDGLWHVPVGHGEGQRGRTDGGRRAEAGRGDGDVGARLGVESHGVGRGACFGHGDGVGREAQAVDLVVGRSEGKIIRQACIAGVAAGGDSRDGGDAIRVVLDVVIDSGDGDDLRGEPGAGGEGQRVLVVCCADGCCTELVAGRGDGHCAGWRGVELHGIGGYAAVFSGTAAGGRQVDAGLSAVIPIGEDHCVLCSEKTRTLNISTTIPIS